MEQTLINELLKPSLYPDITRTVTMLQTHVSFLFLTDNFVYKIKKPVDLGFLNFTTLDRRRFYCEEELRLNRRLCPDVYLEVVSIRVTDDGCVSFNGKGTIIDYAVKMRRLPADRMLETLLQQNKVGLTDIRRIAATIAEFHRKAETSPDIARYGEVSVIRQNWDENFRQTADFVGITIARVDLNLIRKWVDDFILHNSDYFEQRVSKGYIRDCNGDIHAENICIEEKVCIFDCIEFNERFRYIDTAADIAFLLMDFDYHDQRSLSEFFLKEYCAFSGDCNMTVILDFYKVYRAFVRGKVESFKLNDPDITDADKASAKIKAARHFRLARGYIVRRNMPPSLIIFSGLMGTGKSTLAKELGFELGIDVLRSDIERKKLTGIDSSERQLVDYNTGIYSPGYTRATYSVLLQTADAALRADSSIIIDASFLKRSDRETFRMLAQQRHCPFFIINTYCPEESVKERLEGRISDSNEPSDGRWELFQLQQADAEAVSDSEGRHVTVDTSASVCKNIEVVLSFLGLRQEEYR